MINETPKPKVNSNLLQLFDRPTPLDFLFSDQFPEGLLIKRDDIASSSVGGSKLRALEFVLAEALDEKIDTIVSSGFAGSTSLTTLAIACAHLNLQCVVVTPPFQKIAAISNLAISAVNGCHFKVVSSGTPLRSTAPPVQSLVQELVVQGHRVFIVPFGITHPRGLEGYVLAINELTEQLKARGLLFPRRIYVACATGRLALGLAVGAAAQQLMTEIVAVRVVPFSPVFHSNFAEILETSSLSAKLLGNQSQILSRIRLVDGTDGQSYGTVLLNGQSAAKICQQMGGPPLEQTYTAKVFATMLNELETTQKTYGPWLFWHSANGRQLSSKLCNKALDLIPSALLNDI